VSTPNAVQGFIVDQSGQPKRRTRRNEIPAGASGFAETARGYDDLGGFAARYHAT
jgi:hypothetical protein